MNVNASMQNLSSPKETVNAVGDSDALAILVQQSEVSPEVLAANPELVKLAESNPEGLDFKDMLSQTEVREVINNPDLLSGIEKRSVETNKAIVKGENRVELIDSNNSLVEKKQVEEKSKQFMPERKSIFDMSSKRVDSARPNQTSSNLQNLSEFVQNQSPTKKIAMKNAYKPKISSSLFAKKIESQVPELTGVKNTEVQMKVSDLILSSNEGATNDQGSEFLGHGANNKTTELSSTSTQSNKVFDLNQLVTNKSDVIGQIQDYIIQSKASNEPSMSMSFEHKELGMIDLQINKADNNQLNIMINSRTSEGSKFFTQNQAELLQTLNQAGIQVADLKLDSSSNSNLNQNNNNDSSFAGNKEGQSQGQQKNERNPDSKRREELWKLFEEREAA